MKRIIDKTVMSKSQPGTTNVLWFQPETKILHIYLNGEWMPIGSINTSNTSNTSENSSNENNEESNINKAFLRVSQVDSQDNTLVFIEGSKEEILEKLNAFDAFDVEYIYSNLYEGFGEIGTSSCLCHVNKQIEDYGTIKIINIFVPFPEFDNQTVTSMLMVVQIYLFKPDGSDNYLIQRPEDANPIPITENVSIQMEDETYTGITIGVFDR